MATHSVGVCSHWLLDVCYGEGGGYVSHQRCVCNMNCMQTPCCQQCHTTSMALGVCARHDYQIQQLCLVISTRRCHDIGPHMLQTGFKGGQGVLMLFCKRVQVSRLTMFPFLCQIRSTKPPDLSTPRRSILEHQASPTLSWRGTKPFYV